MDKPDTMEKGIRLGCGAALGLLTGAVCTWYFFDFHSTAQAMIATGVCVVVFALLALFLGDRFWRAVADFPLLRIFFLR